MSTTAPIAPVETTTRPTEAGLVCSGDSVWRYERTVIVRRLVSCLNRLLGMHQDSGTRWRRS